MRGQKPSEHGECGEVDLRVAVRVGVVLVELELALVVEQPIEHERRVAVGAFDRHAVEGRVVVGNEGVELKREVAEACAVRLLEHAAGQSEPLPVARGRLAFAPPQRGIEAGDRVHEFRQGAPLRLLGELPVADAFELVVGDVRDELRHRVRADVAAVGHDRGEQRADVLRRRLLPLRRRHEVPCEAHVVVHLDEEIRQPDATHALRQPALEFRQPRLSVLVEFLRGVGREMPPVLVGHGVAVGGCGLAEPIVRLPETTAAVRRYFFRVRGKVGAPEEVLAHAPPRAIVDEEVIETAKPLAVLHGEIPGLDLVAKPQEKRALPRLAVDLAVPLNDRAQPLENEVDGAVVRKFATPGRVRVLEDTDGPHTRGLRGAVSTLGECERLQQDRREPPQHPVASHDPVEEVAALAGDPLHDAVHAGRELVSRHGFEQPSPQFAVGD
jgi:hypothetical protein